MYTHQKQPSILGPEDIPLYGSEYHVEMFRKWPVYIDWVKNRIDSRFPFIAIEIRDALIISQNDVPAMNNADLTLYRSDHFPWNTCMVGGAVAAFIKLILRDQAYVVCVRQDHSSPGFFDGLSLPAGMTEGRPDPILEGVREVMEETGIEGDVADFQNLSALYYNGAHPGAYSSAGKSDEYVTIIGTTMHVDDDFMEKYEGRVAGLEAEGERSKVALIRIEDLGELAPMFAVSEAMKILYEFEYNTKYKHLKTVTNVGI